MLAPVGAGEAAAAAAAAVVDAVGPPSVADWFPLPPVLELLVRGRRSRICRIRYSFSSLNCASSRRSV